MQCARILHRCQPVAFEDELRDSHEHGEKIVEAIDECDVGVIPNRRSIFTELNTPTRIFEYLSRGKPVIAPSAPGIQDYFSGDALVFFAIKVLMLPVPLTANPIAALLFTQEKLVPPVVLVN